jgi:small subunit ribosomal protein S17
MSEQLEATDATTETATTATEPKTIRLQKVGTVVSDKMNKTIVVEVSYLRKHPLYKKQVRKSTRFKAHDENNECKVGDLVRIEECRPLSRDKYFRLVEIVKRAD